MLATTVTGKLAVVTPEKVTIISWAFPSERLIFVPFVSTGVVVSVELNSFRITLPSIDRDSTFKALSKISEILYKVPEVR